MKKLLICLVVLAFLLMPAMAMAYNDGEDLPNGAVEVEHWELINDTWVSFKPNVPSITMPLARCWRSSPKQGNCNRAKWEFDFTHHASMAQWCDWSIGGSRWDWRILKPGTYAADCIEFTLKSNNDVKITFAGFGDLQYQQVGAGVKQTIDTYYSWGESVQEADRNGWTPASALNDVELLARDDKDLHEGLSAKLMNKIVVVECNSSCEYENKGTITIALQNIKRWVDPTTGGWK